MSDRPGRPNLKLVRLLAWSLVVVALVGMAALALVSRWHAAPPQAATGPVKTSFGGPFTLIGDNGKSFSNQALAGKPYAIYFGFTRCGDVCPTTLSRLVQLRRKAATDQALRIVFVTIDPTHDGPREVGQYAAMFNAPIIGLTGSPAQIEQVKKQFGIFAQPSEHPMPGKEMEHTATVLLFDAHGNFAGTINPDEGDEQAVNALRKLLS